MEDKIKEMKSVKETCESVEPGKRVRWSVDLEEVRYYVATDGMGKRLRKRLRKIKEKADDAMRDSKFRVVVDFSDAGVAFEKIVGASFALFTKKLQFKSRALDFENIRDLSDKQWDEMFELYSPKEFQSGHGDSTECFHKVEGILDT